MSLNWKFPPLKARPSSVFDDPKKNSDLTLIVEGRQLHVNKGILASASAVFERMFEGDFREKNAESISLPHKTYDDIVEMLLCIYPSELKAITREKVDVLLQLADEYQMVGLTRRCEQFLLPYCEVKVHERSMASEELVHLMYLADKYKMDKLVEKTTDIASERNYKEKNHPWYYDFEPLVEQPDYNKISDKTLRVYLSKRVSLLEKRLK